MNEQQNPGVGQGGQVFEEIRILGLETADDSVEPGRSVFDEQSVDRIFHTGRNHRLGLTRLCLVSGRDSMNPQSGRTRCQLTTSPSNRWG